MAQFIEFIGNHWILTSLWMLALAALLWYQQNTGSRALAPQQVVTLINRSDAVVVDVRDKKEYEAGHLVDSKHIPLAKFAQRITELAKSKQTPVVVVCKMGQHASDPCKQLQAAGHEQVYKMSGGIAEWKAQNLPLVKQEQKSSKQKGTKKEQKSSKKAQKKTKKS